MHTFLCNRCGSPDATDLWRSPFFCGDCRAEAIDIDVPAGVMWVST